MSISGPAIPSCRTGPHLYLLHLLQTNPVRSEANPQLPQFRTIQVCSKDVPIAPW
jgi:hypothetical protein